MIMSPTWFLMVGNKHFPICIVTTIFAHCGDIVWFDATEVWEIKGKEQAM